MDAIAPEPPELHRIRCQIHALKRAEQRGIDLDVGALLRLEGSIERLRRAWVQPEMPADRYWFNVRHRGGRCRVLYDARLRCIVTVMRDRRLG